LNIFVRPEQRKPLLYDVLLVGFGHIGSVRLDELYNPARVQVDKEAYTSPVLCEVFDREAQAAWACRTYGEPVCPFWKSIVGKRMAERLVIDSEILYVDPRFWHARAPARLKDIDRFIRISSGHPSADRPAAQPFVLKGAKS
jgi:hypothetical protein